MTTNYQNLPTVQYQHTEVSMDDVIAYLQSLEFVAEVKRATYIIFRNESANGTAGINNNFIGLQTDGSRWPDGISAKIIGNVPKTENGTGHLRVFAAFASWKDSVDILVNRVIGRGLYIGGARSSDLQHEDQRRGGLRDRLRSGVGHRQKERSPAAGVDRQYQGNV